MSQDEKRHRRLINKKAVISLFSFVLIYFIIRSMPLIFGDRYKTVLPENDILYKKVEGEGLVIKNEMLYFADSSGLIDQSLKEGEMAAVGAEVASISLLKDTSGLKQELLEVEQKISALSNSDKEIVKLEDGKIKIEEMKIELIADIQDSINKGDYLNIYKSKENILLYDNKLKDVSQENTLLGLSLENLKDKRDRLKTEISSNKLKYYTQDSGIVSYNIDGLENAYLPKDFENYTYESFSINGIENKKLESTISAGSPIFKIIDNFEWYMAIKIKSKNDIKDYKIGQALTIELENSKELKGKIMAINITNDNAVIVIMLNTYLHENYNLRFTQLNIINYKKESFKIPTKVIVEKDGKKGVYIKEINGIVKFRPIFILGISDEYTYIDKGDNNGYFKFDGDEKPSKTITLYDEIFLDSSKVKEGQILK